MLWYLPTDAVRLRFCGGTSTTNPHLLSMPPLNMDTHARLHAGRGRRSGRLTTSGTTAGGLARGISAPGKATRRNATRRGRTQTPTRCAMLRRCVWLTSAVVWWCAPGRLNVYAGFLSARAGTSGMKRNVLFSHGQRAARDEGRGPWVWLVLLLFRWSRAVVVTDLRRPTLPLRHTPIGYSCALPF